MKGLLRIPGGPTLAVLATLVVVIYLSASDENTHAIPDPATGYCYVMGYESRIDEGPEGQYGICIFPDGSECDEWAFFAGTCGQAYSYCVRMGYDLITKTDGRNSYSPTYSVCVQNGQEIGSVTDLIDVLGGELIDLPEIATPTPSPVSTPLPPDELPITGGAPGDTERPGTWLGFTLLTASFLAIASLAAFAHRGR